MLEKFVLKEEKKGIIQGYHWPLDEPKKIICIIHGIGEYGGRYDRVARRFNEAGYAVLSMDLRGHGLSIGRKGDCSPREAVLDDISALIAFAAGRYRQKGIILYGHSMGGNITLDYRKRGAFRDMPAGYLISSPWIRLVKPIPDSLYHMVRAFSKPFPSLTFGSKVREEDLGNPESVLPYHDDEMIHNKISLRCAVECYETGKMLEKIDEETNYSQVGKIPTLFMHGEEDRICDIEGTRACYEVCRARGDRVSFRQWPGLFHELHNGGSGSRGDEVIDEAIEFFGSC